MEAQHQPTSEPMSPETFTREASALLHRCAPGEIALISLDFDNFNYINDLFGYDAGDSTLAAITTRISSCLLEGEIFSRLHADHFVMLLHCTQETLIHRLQAMLQSREILGNILPAHYSLVCGGGIAQAWKQDEPLSALLDKANFARKLAKGGHTNSFLYYDAQLDAELHWRKSVTLSMEAALENHEFEMYLQPKIMLKNGAIVGAEALVRWNSSSHGLVMPDRFIPIFEQNGFIRQLDFFMLEQACCFIRSLIDSGKQALPISVNFSKLHIRSEQFAERVFQVVSQYNLPTKLLEIEFTESVFSEDFDTLAQITGALKYLGFKVSLDDFGSAYSSLNLLKDLPLDIIKIDKAFLSDSAETQRGRLIIRKVVELAKSLRLVSVMEGVETEEQVAFLQKLSCDLGQGYHYARPMQQDAFCAFFETSKGYSAQALLAPELEIDSDDTAQDFQMDSWELYTLGQNIDMGLMKSYLNGKCIVQYVNDRALEYLNYTRKEFRELFHNRFLDCIHPEDIPEIQGSIVDLLANGTPLQFKIRALRKDGKYIVLQGRISCVMDGEGHAVGLYAFQDVTHEQEHTEALENSLKAKIAELEQTIEAGNINRDALRFSEERYRLIVEQSDDIMFEWDFQTDSITFSEKYNKLFGRSPIQGHISTNPATRQRVHPDDIGEYESWVARTFRQPTCAQAEMRFQTATGNYLWMRVRSTPIFDKSGAPARAVGVFSNIHQQKSEMSRLKRKSQLDPLTKLYNKEETHRRVSASLAHAPTDAAAFFIIDVDNFKGVNDNLGHQLGDSVLVEVTQKIKKLFRKDDIVGRIGGDEFAVFTRGFVSQEALEKKAEQLVNSIGSTYFGANSQYSISGSVGIACCPQHGSTMEALFENADLALYGSKRHGKNRFTIFSDEDKAGAPAAAHARTPLERTDHILRHYYENDYIYNIFEMLYETKDPTVTIQKILEMTGRRFHVARVYIFQNNADCTTTNNLYEWCAPDIASQKDLLQNVPIENLQDYLSAYNEEGILCCSDIQSLDPFARALLELQGVTAVLHCQLETAGQLTGFIGFDVCEKTRDWTSEEMATLSYLARILSVFMAKNYITQALLTSHRNYEEMLGNLNGYVYVVDTDTHELLYLNRATEQLGLAVGKKCYEDAFALTQPCNNCPFLKITDAKPFASSEIYSQHLQGWVNAAASRLHWSGHKNAALMCCTDISDYKKN